MQSEASHSTGNPSDAVIAEVAVYSDQKLLVKYALKEGEYIIGRDSTCHIQVDAEQVSRHHARLTLSGFELVIEDLHSSNGIFIEGVQVQIPTRIRADQEVQIGSARLRIGLAEASARQLAEALWDKDLGLEPVRQVLEAKKYRVTTTIARGGMGVIMQARDLRIRRTVAMKVMKTSSQFSRENLLRFIDEAQLTGQLEHPNIVPVYELGIDESGETFYAMKYVKGTTLDEVLCRLRGGDPQTVSKYPLATLITIFQKICDAMAFAHSKGVVHRDLKPQNVMIGAYGEVLVMDWGLAKNMTAAAGHEAPRTADTHSHVSDGRGFQTLNGLIVGTPPYISPEQARGELDEIDARSDVFVLGEILYAILTLRPPIEADDVAEVVEILLSGTIAPPTDFNPSGRVGKGSTPGDPGSISLAHCPGRRIPEGLSAVAMKAMNVVPELRYQRVGEMQADILAWQGGFATKAERAGLKKQVLLFVGRHRREAVLLAIAFVVFNVMVVGFIYQLAVERNLALASQNKAIQSEQRALQSEQLAEERFKKLVGSAPIYADEARSLFMQGRFEEALDRINYAIEQVPNDSEYHELRGHCLLAGQRWSEASESYQESLRLNPAQPKLKAAWELADKLDKELALEGRNLPLSMMQFRETLREVRLRIRPAQDPIAKKWPLRPRPPLLDSAP